MTQYATLFQGDPVPLASGFTKLLDGTNRVLLDIQNDSSHDVQLYYADDPFCLSCDGGDHVTINGVSTDATLVASTEGRIDARIRLDAVGTTERTIVSVSDTSANEYMRLYVDTAGKLKAELRTAAAEQWNIVLTQAFEANKWYKVRLTHNGTKPRLFVNGSEWVYTLTATTDATAWFSTLSNLDNARIASLNTNGAGEADWFIGKIDWLEINTGISVALNWAKTAQYHMTEGSGATLDDLSANGHDGTFGAAGAAPTWDTVLGPVILGPGGGKFYDASVPQTAIWMHTTGSTGTIWQHEGLYTAPAPMGM